MIGNLSKKTSITETEINPICSSVMNFLLWFLLFKKNIIENIFILFFILIFAALFTYKGYNPTLKNNSFILMLAGTFWSVFASVLVLEPTTRYQKEKAYLKHTYINILLLNYSLEELVKFAHKILGIYSVTDLFQEGTALKIDKKLFLLSFLLNKLSEKGEDEFSSENIEEYNALKKDLKYRIDDVFETTKFLSTKNLIVSDIFFSITQNKFFMPDNIKTYKKFSSQIGLFRQVFLNIKETIFLEELFNYYTYLCWYSWYNNIIQK